MAEQSDDVVEIRGKLYSKSTRRFLGNVAEKKAAASSGKLTQPKKAGKSSAKSKAKG